MSDIICPNCGKTFTIDESGYSEILKQVHDKEFDKALRDRMELAEVERNNAIHTSHSV